MIRQGWIRRAAAVGVAVLACAGVARADWLVMKGRTRIETRGAWEVNGNQVVFTNRDGRLVTLPVILIDLEASRMATAEARVTPAPTPISATPTPLAVVTDEDVAHVGPGAAAEENDGTAASGQPSVTLYSTSWCGWCRKTRALLAELGVQYVELDVDRDPRARSELLRLTGGSFGVPVLDIGGTVVRGYSPDRIKALLAPPPSEREAPKADEGPPN